MPRATRSMRAKRDFDADRDAKEARPKPGHCSSPERIRTAVSALRGRRPRPLDDGARTPAGFSHRTGTLGGEDSNPQ